LLSPEVAVRLNDTVFGDELGRALRGDPAELRRAREHVVGQLRVGHDHKGSPTRDGYGSDRLETGLNTF
jgi:hypothetical protein